MHGALGHLRNSSLPSPIITLRALLSTIHTGLFKVRDRTLVNSVGLLLGGRHGRVVVDVVDSLARTDDVRMLQVGRSQSLNTSHKDQDLLPGLFTCEFALSSKSIDRGMNMGYVGMDDPVVDSLTPVVDSFPLVPGFDLDLVVSRSEMFLDDRVSLDLSDSTLNVRDDVRLEDMSAVSHCRLTNVTFPGRDGRVGVGERVDVVQAKP